MRGDVETIRQHLDAMQARAPELKNLYQEMGRQTILVAQDKGSITRDIANELLAVLNGSHSRESGKPEQ
jgi:hypothetical protein